MSTNDLRPDFMQGPCGRPPSTEDSAECTARTDVHETTLAAPEGDTKSDTAHAPAPDSRAVVEVLAWLDGIEAAWVTSPGRPMGFAPGDEDRDDETVVRIERPPHAADTVRALVLEVGRLRADAERLDWLNKNGYISGLRRYSDGTWSIEVDDDGSEYGPPVVTGNSWREAVDHARAAGAGAGRCESEGPC